MREGINQLFRIADLINMTNKASLAKELKKTGRSYRETSLYLGIIVKTIASILSKGNSIQLRGLGTFEIKVTPAKTYPSSFSESKHIPSHGRIVFKPSKKLKQAVWDHFKDK